MDCRSEFFERQDALRALMLERGAGALVAASAARADSRGALRYLANYHVPVFEEHFVLTEKSSVLFVHDGCGADYARRHAAADEVRIVPADEYDCEPGKCVAEYIKSLGVKEAAICGNGYSAGFYRSLLRGLERAPLDLASELDGLRAKKREAEIPLAEAAVKLNEASLLFYLERLAKCGDIKSAVAEASGFAYEKGAEDLYWMASCGAVPQAAFLSEMWSRGPRAEGERYHYIILEHAAAGGHYGEVTQLVSFGAPKPEYADAFAAVRDALLAAADKMRPGAEVCEMAQASTETLVRAGYMEKPSEGAPSVTIGHSQGYDIYEQPRISSGCHAAIEEGMRFSLHPAVRLADGAVITCCDSYIADKTGPRRLSELPLEITVI